MSDKTRYQTLIEETLNRTRQSPVIPGGCLVTDDAAKELRECGLAALPEIEEAVRERIVPDAKTCVDHHELLGKHIGLLGLWMAYFIIGEAEQMPRMIQFLRSLDGPLLATAILAMTPTWLYRGSDAVIPKPLLDFVREVAETRTGSVAEVARYLV